MCCKIRSTILLLTSLVYFCNTEEIRFRNNVYNPAVEVDASRMMWTKESLSQLISNEEDSLKATYNAFNRKGVNIPDLKRKISKNMKDYKSDNESGAEIDFGQCLEQFDIWWDDLEKGKLYALKMWDAWGKQEGGILEGNVRWPGHYHECIDAVGPEVKGRWCQAYFGRFLYPLPMGIPIDVTKGLCFPSVCSSDQVEALYSKLFLDQNELIPLLDVQCPDKVQWSTIDTVCTCVIAVLLLLSLVGFVLDVAQRFNKRGSSNIDRITIPSKPVELMVSFSPLSNGEKILASAQRRGTIPALDGIRFISTTWVVLGHTCSVVFLGLDNTLQGRRRVLEDPSLMPIINGTFSVDTFFLLSGLLVAYLGMKEIEKRRGNLNIPLMYLQRYLRLTPLYAFIILFSMSLYNFTGDSIAWKTYADYNYDTCKDNWWTNLVYINNLYPKDNACFGLGWYLANDMQFYLVAPIFLFLLYRWRIIGILSICLVILGGMITDGVLASINDLQPVSLYIGVQLSFFYRYFLLAASNAESTYEDKLSTDLYTLPWARINVYMIGMLTGYILYIKKGKVNMHPVVVGIGWNVACGSALAIVYGFYENVTSMTFLETDLAAFYQAVARPAWGACVAWVVVACSSGYGGPIKTFLNWKVFTPLSRLTYSAYLVHFLILDWYAVSQDQPLHFLMINVVYIFLGTLVLTFLCAFVLAISVEWPFIGFCKVFLTPKPVSVIHANVNLNSSEMVEVSTPQKDEENISNPPEYSSVHDPNGKMASENEGFEKEVSNSIQF